MYGARTQGQGPYCLRMPQNDEMPSWPALAAGWCQYLSRYYSPADYSAKRTIDGSHRARSTCKFAE